MVLLSTHLMATMSKMILNGKHSVTLSYEARNKMNKFFIHHLKYKTIAYFLDCEIYLKAHLEVTLLILNS